MTKKSKHSPRATDPDVAKRNLSNLSHWLRQQLGQSQFYVCSGGSTRGDTKITTVHEGGMTECPEEARIG